MFYKAAFTELRVYIDIVRRRRPMILIPIVIVVLVSILTFNQPLTIYQSSVKYIVGQEPAPDTFTEEQARNWSWIVSQYVVNGVKGWTEGTDFSGRISDRLEVDHPQLYEEFDLDTREVEKIVSSGTIRSELTVVVRHFDEEVVETIANIATEVLRENDLVIPQLRNTPARVVPIDRVLVEEFKPELSVYIGDLPLRIFVAIAAGVGLALLVEYLDPKVRSAAQIERMSLVMLGEIPTE